MDIYDKIKEIKELLEDTSSKAEWDDENIAKMFAICEDILIDHQVKQRLAKDFE